MTDSFLKIAPFQLFSSSVDTGYNAEISASFKPGIDITNMKTDRYSDLNDAPMQGPFTEKYVGGSQYRHVPLNDGNDTPLTRPELYNITMTSSILKVIGPDNIDVNRARAPYFRDGFSKRPVNIANIHTTGSDVGNYQHDYQVVQTVSRTTNNRAFTEATGSGFAQYLTTQFVSGAKDPNRALPDFDIDGKNEFVFVNRFNAPGGTQVSSRGVLDTYAEEYAPANDINTRNYTVRSQLRSDLARHTPKAGTGIPTQYHNDNRNPKIDFTKDPIIVTSSGIAPLVEQKLTASDGQADDYFGYSVSIVPGLDGIYALCGAVYEDPKITNEGAAYIYHSTSAGITEQKLTASDGSNLDFFGSSVSLASGSDGIYALCGAHRDDGSIGSAYIYHSTSAGITEQKLTASDGQANDYFGYSVSLASGSDGIYALCGAYNAFSISTGSAYIYHSTGAGITEQKLTASDGALADKFGYSVSIASGSAGIYALCGAPGEDPAGIGNAGSAYIYHSTSAGITEQKLTASDGSTVDSFGSSVSIAPGSDGIYALCGAYQANNPSDDEGSAYIYHSTSAGITEQKLTASDGQIDDYFGYSVSIASGSDGIYALCGAYQADPGGELSAGAAYVYRSTSAGITEQKLIASDGFHNDRFGYSVSIAFGSDGTHAAGIFALCGAYAEDPAAISAAGSAYIYSSPAELEYSFIHSQSYDNGFITHAIPRSDLKYRWIQASALTTEAELPGYQHSSSTPFGPYDDINYVLDSGNPALHNIIGDVVEPSRGDFIGISGTGLDKSGIEVQTPLGSMNLLSKTAATIFNVYNGPYQYSSWNQVRNSYNPIVRQLVRESILSLANPQKTTTNSLGNQVFSKRSDGVTNYKEPVVSENAHPVEHNLLVRPDLTSQQTVSSSLKYSFANNLSSFTRQSIVNKANIQQQNQSSMYDDIKDYYLKSQPGGDNPVEKLLDIKYSQGLYPAVANTFINITRERTEYSEVAGTGSNGYDRIFGKQRTFYKEDEIRNSNAPNSQGFAPSENVIDFSSSYDFSENISTNFINDDSSIVRLDDTSGSNAFCFGTNPGSSPSTRFLQWKDAFLTSSVSSDISLSFEITRGYYGSFDGSVWLDEPETGELITVQYRLSDGGAWQTADTILPGDLTAGNYSLTASSFDPGGPAFVRISQEVFSGQGTSNGYQYDNYAIRNLNITASTVDINKPALNFNSMATDGIKSFPESASYRDYNGELMQDSDETMFSTSPLPSLSYLELYNIRVNQSSTGYVERLTEQIAGESSWYDTYNDYAVDVRPHTKNKSIIPEFRMSDHIPYYIVDKGNDFRAPNKKILSLNGASITSSAESVSSELFDNNFVTKYVQSSNTARFASMTDEHEDVASVSNVSFTCKGIKKLLPYNGFYPKDRTVQIGNLLSESLSTNVEGAYEGVEGSFPKQGWQGILKPLMSPGILYNSIKSGIAVDYPIYTGSVPGLVAGDNTPSDFRLDVGPNYRLPFETLVDVKGNLPEGTENPIRLVSAFVTDESDFNTDQLFNYKSVWNGQKTDLFELGMHNFLAETVDFFLPQSGLSNFRSQPENEWDRFKEGTSYYMDIVLRDSVEMNKFIEYSGSGEIVENLKFGASDGELSDRFGFSVDTVEGSPGEGIYAVVGSPLDTSAYLFQNKFDTTGWKQKLKLTTSDSQLDDSFGFSVSITSGTSGIYCLVGSSNHDAGASSNVGAAYLFHSSSSGVVTEQKLTSSDGGADENFGTSVSVFSGSDSIHCLVGSPGGLGDASYDGAAYLFHSKSSETFYIDGSGLTNQKWQTKITASDPIFEDVFGWSVSLSSGSDSLYMLVGNPEHYLPGPIIPPNADAGALYLYHSKSSEPFYVDSAGAPNQKWQTKITSSDASGGRNLGYSVSVVSGTDEIYMIAGQYNDGSYLFHSKSGETFYIDGASPVDQEWQTKLTASDAGVLDAYGTATSLTSGSDGIYCLVGAYLASSSLGEDAGKSYIYHSESAGVSEQIMSASDGAPKSFFGYSVSLVSSSVLPDELYATMGATTASFAVSGSGAGYMFAGTFGSLSGTIGIQNVQQDYKQHGKLFGLPLEDAYDPAYAAYTPPMFYGEAVARIKFTPTVTDSYTLDEIIDQATVEEIITVDSNRVATVNGFAKSLTTLQEQNRMPVSSSVDLFGKYFEKGATWNAESGQARTIDGTVVQPSWVVSTKFESPVLDVSSSKYNDLYSAHLPDADMATSFNFYPGAINRTNPRTMWTSYGKTPTGTKAVTLELKESFPHKVLGRASATTGSLIQQCKFKGTKKKVGTVRGTKEISEAIVMIPYLDKAVRNVTTQVEGYNLIRLNRSIYNIQKQNFEKEGIAVKTAARRNNEQIESTTFTDMFQAMENYNVPPNMDFLKYDDIAPFAMYFFEFNQTLDQDDLTDIWQGTMPKAALKVEKDEVTIEHQVDPYEFFGNIQDQALIGQMKFFTFKVKKKAKQNYYEITKDATDDSRFRFTFSSDPQATAVPPQGSYNWPYDYFSLVEGIDIEAKYTLKNKDEG